MDGAVRLVLAEESARTLSNRRLPTGKLPESVTDPYDAIALIDDQHRLVKMCQSRQQADGG